MLHGSSIFIGFRIACLENCTSFFFFNIPNNMAKIGHTKYKGLQFKASEDIIYIFTFDMVPFLLAIILLCFFVKWLNLVIKCILCAQDSYVGI